MIHHPRTNERLVEFFLHREEFHVHVCHKIIMLEAVQRVLFDFVEDTVQLFIEDFHDLVCEVDLELFQFLVEDIHELVCEVVPCEEAFHSLSFLSQRSHFFEETVQFKLDIIKLI